MFAQHRKMLIHNNMVGKGGGRCNMLFHHDMVGGGGQVDPNKLAQEHNSSV